MKSVTDLFIEKPVLSGVVSLLILILGLRSIESLELRQYPKTEDTVITVTTSLPGADSDSVKSFITTPLQQVIAETSGIDYIKATSRPGVSVIEIYLKLNFAASDAVAQVQAKVASRRNVLPREADDPVIEVQTGSRLALMYLAFYSDDLKPTQLTDFLLRVIRPQFQAIQGVAKAEIYGKKTYAMRVWLDPIKLFSHDVTANEVRISLLNNNFLSTSGETKGDFVAIDLSASTDLTSVSEFSNLVVRKVDDTIIRLRDLGRVELGADDYDSTAWYNGKTALFIGIKPTPGSNPIKISNEVRDTIERIESDLPSGIKVFVPYDASEFIEDSINEVFKTIIEAVIIVLIVLFLSLGSIKAALIPALTLPLCLIGSAFFVLLMGFSANLLTLLALVLAIGLVVDDAIVVVENVCRLIEQGSDPKEAALIGSRQLVIPIIAMTTTLIAVYLPIGFMEGIVGMLFTEFAFALASAVFISGIIALTLSPMLCSKLINSDDLKQKRKIKFPDSILIAFTNCKNIHRNVLNFSLNNPYFIVSVCILSVIGLTIFYFTANSELAPEEDQSILYVSSKSPQTATLDYNITYANQMIEAFQTIPEYKESFMVIGFDNARHQMFGGFKMPSTDERSRDQKSVQQDLQTKLFEITGVQSVAFPRSSLPTPGRGLPIQFVILSPEEEETLDKVANNIIGSSLGTGKFLFLRKSIEFNRPLIKIEVDRSKAGLLGINMDALGLDLSTLLGGNYVNRFSQQGRSYKVIPQVEQKFRENQGMLNNYYIRSTNDSLVPLSSFASFKETVEPSERLQFQQMNAIIVEGVVSPSSNMGEAIKVLENNIKSAPFKNLSWDYAGEARQFKSQSSALIVTFLVSLMVIYLVLAAQFESWVDPLIILTSVPLSLFGALFFASLGLVSLNIYTQVGLITLIGLVAKNGILIVEFANRVIKEEGASKREAIEKASLLRLRPILMTTVATIVAMIPLLIAVGPGAESRFQIGLIISTGLGFGTIFTLFVVPVFYIILSQKK